MTNQSESASIASDDARSRALPTWRTPVVIVGFGYLIGLMAFGPRSSLGFFLTPLSVPIVEKPVERVAVVPA